MDTKKSLTLRVSTMCFGIALGALVILSLVGVAHTVRAQNLAAESLLYSFRPSTGYLPSPLIARDSAGNIYGTTIVGDDLSCGGGGGCGNIFKVSPTGQQTILYTWMSDRRPNGVILDAKGNLYGSTASGGTDNAGTVFKLTPTGLLINIHFFAGGATDGGEPIGALVRDSAGNLYGVTGEGGGNGCGSFNGCGTIYKITPSGQETVLYSFTGGADGSYPEAGPVLDSAGNLYGTDGFGSNSACDGGLGCGTVYKLDTSGNLTVLHSFTGGTDGAFPQSGLVRDSLGNLYGAASYGGDLSCYAPQGCGVVYKIDSSGNFTVLHAFSGGSNDGENPFSTLVRDAAGNLYGTTYTGGDQSCTLEGNPGCGVVFKLDASGNETILHAFTGGTTDGALTFGSLISDGKGNLYGSTRDGGSVNGGVVFRVRTQ